MPEHRSLLAVVAEACGLGAADQSSQPKPDLAAEPNQPAERHSAVVDIGQRFSLVTGTNGPVVGAQHVEQLRAKGVNLTAQEAEAVDAYASTWNGSPDIQNEFRSFANFVAYMRAKAAGRAKILGQP